MAESGLHKSESHGSAPVTIRRALEKGTRYLAGRGIESGRLDAELLLCMIVGCGRERLYADYERPLGEREEELFLNLLERRGAREPVAYITGRREFWSMDFFVTPDVLVPRPETELLVEVGLKVIGESGENPPVNILDIGTGSGVIAVSLAKEQIRALIWATDLSRETLEVTRRNADFHGVEERIRFIQGDLFKPVEGRTLFFHLIVCNPPYVRRHELDRLSPEVRDWEPRAALDGGVDGLDLYRRLIGEAPLYLVEGGFLALEMGADMARDLLRLIEKSGFYSESSIYQDYAGRDRVLVARKR